jgi:hypothetical protein
MLGRIMPLIEIIVKNAVIANVIAASPQKRETRSPNTAGIQIKNGEAHILYMPISDRGGHPRQTSAS